LARHEGVDANPRIMDNLVHLGTLKGVSAVRPRCEARWLVDCLDSASSAEELLQRLSADIQQRV